MVRAADHLGLGTMGFGGPDRSMRCYGATAMAAVQAADG